MIPKIIHYCWLSNDPLPEDFKKYMDGWKTVLSDYEFIKWDFNRFPKDKSAWVSEAFDHKKYAFAADYIRLYAVYHYGGIYMDMDMEVLKSFNDLLDKPYMFAKENKREDWIEAGCFGAEKNNEFIGKCLERYEGRHFVKEDGSLDTVPLPIVLDGVRIANKIKLKLYSWDYFTAKIYSSGEERPTNNTYTIHHFAGSWLNESERRRLVRERKICSIFGSYLGRNMFEFIDAFQNGGFKKVKDLTIKKINHKIKKRINNN